VTLIRELRQEIDRLKQLLAGTPMVRCLCWLNALHVCKGACS